MIQTASPGIIFYMVRATKAAAEINTEVGQIKKALASLGTLEVRLKEALNRNPLQSLVSLVAGGGLLYYLAERGKNDKVHTPWDAFEYVGTCASVGYSNIFPVTPVGRMVATVLFVLGPSLAAKALDHPHPRSSSTEPALPPGQQAILAKLEDILVELRRLNR